MIITYQATILKKSQLTENVFLLSLSKPTETVWNFVAGQYMIFHIPQENTHPARRLYSIASAPLQENSLDFVIEQVPGGIGSTFLHNAGIGEKVTVQGPAGLFVYQTSDKNPVFFATGTGIAPIYSMIYQLLETGFDKKINLYWGLKTKSDLYLMTEIETLASKHPNLSYSICLSRETDLTGEHMVKGHVNDAFESMITHDSQLHHNFDYYLCGSKNVVTSLKEYLGQKQLPQQQIHFENFTV